ncbi:8769_t:CDS:2 [Cetraspora pellucida]|uniref:8769_t:CDS:1 n=1 Tax=Cetraspora pellucida TaxID=1433469 RepID=A0A9N9FEB7_9GLOM|nr:8769_t:CDS:2 [Cetraspora pellucida]
MIIALATVINSIRVITAHGSQNASPVNVMLTSGDNKNSTASICVDCLFYDYGYFYLHLIVFVIILLITAFGLIVVCCAIHFASVIREYSIRRKAEEDNPDIPN